MIVSFCIPGVYVKVLVAPPPCQHLLLSVFLAILEGMKYVLVVLIYLSLVTNGVEYLSMCFLVICIFLCVCVKYIFISFAHLTN